MRKWRQWPRATAAGFAHEDNQLHAPDIRHDGALATGVIGLWFAGCMREGQVENCLLLTTGLSGGLCTNCRFVLTLASLIRE